MISRSRASGHPSKLACAARVMSSADVAAPLLAMLVMTQPPPEWYAARKVQGGPPMTSLASAGLHPVSRRICEIVPPVIVWAALTSPAWAAIVAPQVLGYFLVAFSAYWLWRS